MAKKEDEFDLLVVGGGPGGYVAAIRAAQLGMRTALVERDRLGGVCLNWGCIPTKALLRSADVLRLVRGAGEFGIDASVGGVDVAAMVKRSRAVADRLNRGVAGLMKKNGVSVVAGHARLTGNVEDLGLERTTVKVEKGHIVTGPRCETAEPGVYAIGDVAGPPWLAHKASHEGIACVEHIAGLSPQPLDPQRVPACTYSHPQVASVGLTEERAVAAGHRIRVGRFPFAANGKAIAMGATGGVAKVVFDEASGELLGAHLVGEEVAEMIQGFSIATTLEATEADLMATIFPHPTMSEAMHEAVLDAYGRTLHL